MYDCVLLILIINVNTQHTYYFIFTIDGRLSLILVAYTQIDWHDFVVVETVDFQPNEQGNYNSK